MKDETIRVNDIVMVVHSHCNVRQLGLPAVVTEICYSWTGTLRCGGCDKQFALSEKIARLPSLSDCPSNENCGWWPVSWLKKIDPPSLEEFTETSEEIEA